MEMRVNSEFLRAERERRAWSQQHLATVSGLSLRTVQRIEARGTASYESIKALAACLEVSVSVIRVQEASSVTARHRGPFANACAAGLVASILLTAGFLFVQETGAEQVLLDIDVLRQREEKTNEYKTQVLLDDGEAIELPMPGIFKVAVTPTILDDGKVVISFRLFEHRNETYQLLGEPRIVANAGEEASVAIGTAKKGYSSYQLAVTARPQ